MAINNKKEKTVAATKFVQQSKMDEAEKKVVSRTSLNVKKKTLRVGEVYKFQISGLGPNEIGIDEYSFPCAVFIPNAKYGSEIKAKVLKIQGNSYAVAKLTEELKVPEKELEVPVKPGEVITVSLKTKGNAGIAEGPPPNNYRLIVPLTSNDGFGQKKPSLLENVKVTVTRVKGQYGFGKITNLKQSTQTSADVKNEGLIKEVKTTLAFGSKFTTNLPQNSQQYGKYIVFKVQGAILFVKLEKGVNLGDRVRIKITSTSSNCAVGQIVKVNPLSRLKKSSLVINTIREMINHGMHFGEKAVKCHARMKNFIWSTSSSLKGKGSLQKSFGSDSSLKLAQQLSNSKEKSVSRPLIKKGRHIINLLKTRRCLNQALNKLTKYALKGRTFLFIGTKKPAAGLVARASFFTKKSFYVNTRWLGGMLTNWKTICKSISKIRPILKEKQKVVRDILERRQAIKTRLIKKALLLKQKSQLILSKGRSLVEAFKTFGGNKKTEMLSRAQKFNTLRNELMTKGMIYLEKRQKLIQKRRELIYQTLLLKEKGLQIASKHQVVLNQLAIYNKKLREYKYLLILTSEIQNISKNASSQLVSVSYSKLKEVSGSSLGKEENKWIIPNPPKEILNRIVLTMKNQFDNDSLIAAKSISTSQSKELQTGSQVIVCSTLLSKFRRFSSYMKSVMKTLCTSIEALEKQSKQYSMELNEIQNTLQTYLTLKQKYVSELQKLKVKLAHERTIIHMVKNQLKALDAQKKLMKFLPRLRYLPTPQTKISEIVQILLARIVDPKLKYPIDLIYDQKLSTTSKKLAAARKKKWQRLEKYFGGIANMTKLTKTQISRNVAIIIGQKEEINAVRECQKLGIKTFTIVDTNCNPTLSDHVIPANDDSRSAIKYILTKFITRIRLAQKLRSRIMVFKRLSKKA